MSNDDEQSKDEQNVKNTPPAEKYTNSDMVEKHHGNLDKHGQN